MACLPRMPRVNGQSARYQSRTICERSVNYRERSNAIDSLCCWLDQNDDIERMFDVVGIYPPENKNSSVKDTE